MKTAQLAERPGFYRGDLVYNKSIAMAWPDWQQGGTAGGMTGFKQNPTIWLAHLRCTDRHRIGDNTRAMFLGRWGGLGGHRYQVMTPILKLYAHRYAT